MEEDTTIPPLSLALTRRISLIACCTLFGLILAAALPLLLPAQFRATATIAIKNLPSLTATLEEDTAQIKSPEILGPVTDQLDLPKRWGNPSTPLSREDACHHLAKSISVYPVRSELVKISVDDPDPKQAAALANAVALQFQKSSDQRRQKLTEDHLKELQNEVARLHEKTEQFRQIAAALRSQESEADRNSGYMGENLPPQVGTPAYLSAQRNFLQAKEIEKAAQRVFEAAKVQNAMPAKRVVIWERAEPPVSPISTPLITRLALGALLGAILSGLLSFILMRR